MVRIVNLTDHARGIWLCCFYSFLWRVPHCTFLRPFYWRVSGGTVQEFLCRTGPEVMVAFQWSHKLYLLHESSVRLVQSHNLMSSQSLQSAAVTGHAALIYKCVDWEQALVVSTRCLSLVESTAKIRSSVLQKLSLLVTLQTVAAKNWTEGALPCFQQSHRK